MSPTATSFNQASVSFTVFLFPFVLNTCVHEVMSSLRERLSFHSAPLDLLFCVLFSSQEPPCFFPLGFVFFHKSTCVINFFSVFINSLVSISLVSFSTYKSLVSFHLVSVSTHKPPCFYLFGLIFLPIYPLVSIFLVSFFYV